MRQRLIWKVMALNFPVIALVIGVIWLSIDYLAADYFTELMNQYQIAPREIHAMFIDSVHRYMAGASIVAVLMAILLSYWLTNRVLRPLKEVSTAIDKMRSGNRDARARSISNDELGELASAFNSMARQIKIGEELRENMIVDLAHELRTPVTNISGYLEGLRDEVIEVDDHSLHVLQEEAFRLADLVESMLNLARADAAELDLKIQPISVDDVINAALHRHNEQLEKKQLSVTLDIAQDANTLKVDPDRFQTIVNNLIENACQYSSAGGELKIGCVWRNGQFLLEMSNPTENLGPDDVTHVFERFYRSEKSRSRISGGAGIGLAIVKKLVEAHGGSVGANSDQGLFAIWLSIPDTVLGNVPTAS